MRIIARFEKNEIVRYISHLDIQRTVQRAMRRARVPIAYSQGFNPHPQLAFATALSLGYASEAEWLDVKLEGDMRPEAFQKGMNEALPKGLRILEAVGTEDKTPALSAQMTAAQYTITLENGDADKLRTAIDKLLCSEIYVEKRGKAGLKTVDIRPMVLDMSVQSDAGVTRIGVAGRLDAAGSLNIELLMGALQKVLGEPLCYTVKRNAIYSEDGAILPMWRPQ